MAGRDRYDVMADSGSGTRPSDPVVFHGDSAEMERHIVLTAVLYRLSPLVMLACIWERLVFRRRAGAAGADRA
jgi:hypothetical protein